MSTYCERADMEAIFGEKNIESWAKRDDEDVSADVTSLISTFITWASAEIDDYAAKQGYLIPLTTSASATPTPVKYLAAALAGIWLYESKGTFDIDERSGQMRHRYMPMKEWAYRVLQEIQNGDRHLDANPKVRP